jgi:hypothetical protein
MSENVLPNATQPDINRTFVSKIKDLDPSDSEFSSRFEDIYKDYETSRSISRRANAGIKHELEKYKFESAFESVFDNFFINPLMSFSNLHDRINNMITQSTTQIGNFDSNTFTTKTDKPKTVDKESYYKYVSSFTTFNDKGERHSKSISRVEKNNGKHKKISQITKIQDGDKYIEEHLNPDGTTKRIEKTLSQSDKYIQ